MSNKENGKFDDRLSSTENPVKSFGEDPLADTSQLLLAGGSTRRGSAVIS